MASQAVSQAKASITWDEETIAEHDKDRGTRQKIDEPDTPFATYDPATDPDRHLPQSQSPEMKEMKPVAPTSLADGLDELTSKLTAAADASQSRDPETRLEWVADMEADEQKAAVFAKQRSAHYNMSGILGRSNFDDDDDDDDDEG